MVATTPGAMPASCESPKGIDHVTADEVKQLVKSGLSASRAARVLHRRKADVLRVLSEEGFKKVGRGRTTRWLRDGRAGISAAALAARIEEREGVVMGWLTTWEQMGLVEHVDDRWRLTEAADRDLGRALRQLKLLDGESETA